MHGKTTLTLISGVLLGGILTAAMMEFGLPGQASRSAPVRDIVDVDTMDYSAANQHRSSHFADLSTIESLQALPSNFDRAEALYAISGRSSVTELETLAYDALRISDDIWRNRALSIIFFRLADIAPEVALDMAASPDFAKMPSLQRRVWRTWARTDLVAAAVATTALDSDEADTAIQDIYASIGGAYNPAAVTVENLTGVKPSTRNRALYIRHLIEESPSAALEHILLTESDKERRAQVRFLARELARVDVERAEEFAERISDIDMRKAYLDRVYDEMADDEPQIAFIRQFQIRPDKPLSDDETEGFRDLAKNRLDDALALIDQVTDTEVKREIATAIAEDYASQRPEEALDWAKENGGDGLNPLLNIVITELAKTEPELALSEAQQTGQRHEQFQLVSRIISTVANESPQKASQHLGLIESSTLRARAAVTIMDRWLKTDAQAAIDWALSTEPEIATSVFEGRSARQMNLDTALTLVPTLPEEHRASWARTVTRQLIEKRSPEDAFLFVDQFKGSNDYEMQMAHLVGAVADIEPGLAMQWTDNMPAGNARDAAISNVISTTARSDAAGAAALLDQIDDVDLRQVASSEVLMHWQRSDPNAVDQWIQALPRGADRDSIIMNTAVSSARDSEETLELLNTIDDENKRQEAILMHTLMRSRNNPEEMMQQLDQLEMPSFLRQQIKAEILRSAARGN